MKNEIIRIEEREGKQAVSARELHGFLESKKDFSSWIKDRIERYGFVQGVDFEVFTQIGENSKGGRPSIEYALTVDAAKELSMVEGNEKGKQARRYFIEAERSFRQMINCKPNIPQSLSQALRLAADQAEQIEQQQRIIAEQAPRVLFSQAVETSKQSILIGEMAKILCQNGIKIGQTRFFEWLRNKGYLCMYGERYNQPTQRAMELGLFEIKKTPIMKPNGETIVSTTTKVTGKGQIYFVDKFLKSSTLLSHNPNAINQGATV